MSASTADLVARLREIRGHSPMAWLQSGQIADDLSAAAARLEELEREKSEAWGHHPDPAYDVIALRAEVARLRSLVERAEEALRGVVDHVGERACTCDTDADGGYSCPLRIAAAVLTDLSRSAAVGWQARPKCGCPDPYDAQHCLLLQDFPGGFYDDLDAAREERCECYCHENREEDWDFEECEAGQPTEGGRE